MEKCKILIIVGIIALAKITPSSAQETPEDYLYAQNEARSQVGVAPLQWDESVTAFARHYAGKLAVDCRMVHSGGPYGENLAWGGGDLSVAQALNLWLDEISMYDYGSNSCVGGACLHYTQIVWSDSVRLGCAKVRCNNNGTIISCNYDPPGNYIGQRPY